MLESMRLLSNVMVIGDDQRYLTMFVTIKCQVKEVYIHNVLLYLHLIQKMLIYMIITIISFPYLIFVHFT